MLTVGASHSMATARHFSKGTMSLLLVEYSRMRPHPVHVRLQVCRGSSWSTIANLGVRRNLCRIIWPAIFADNAKGNRINGLVLSYLVERLLRWQDAIGSRGRGIDAQNAGDQKRSRGDALRATKAAASNQQQYQDRVSRQKKQQFAI